MTIYGVHWKDTIDYDEGLVKLYFDKDKAQGHADSSNNDEEDDTMYYFVLDHIVY